jgi:hypothetical protein
MLHQDATYRKNGMPPGGGILAAKHSYSRIYAPPRSEDIRFERATGKI